MNWQPIETAPKDGSEIHVEWLDSSTVFVESAQHVANNDPYAATRRAIVRAAAEIGRAMP